MSDVAAGGPIGAAQKPGRIRMSSARACAITAEAGEGKLATFEGVTYTGAPMTPMGWGYPCIIDLAGVVVPSQHCPALRSHDTLMIAGHTTRVTVDADGINVKGVLSGEKQHSDAVAVPARNGFLWQLSVGADPTRTEFLESGQDAVVNGRTVTGPMTISRETVLKEVSFVALGADAETSVTVQGKRRGANVKPYKITLKQLMANLRAAGKATRYSDEDVDKMSEEEAKAALKKCMAEDGDKDDDEDDDDKEKKTEAARVERELEREVAIRAACDKHGVEVCEVDLGGGRRENRNLAEHAVKAGWTSRHTELIALRASRPGPGVGLPGGLGYSSTSPQLNGAVLEAAVLQAARHQYCLEDDDFWTEERPDGKRQRRPGLGRLEAQTRRELKSRYTDQVQQYAHDIFKGRIGLQQLLRTGFGAMQHARQLDLSGEHGIRSALMAWHQHEAQQSIRAEGASNLSLSNILSNVLNKFALQGYLFTEQAWREIAGIRPVSDFKPSKSINLLGDVMYRQVGPSGELQNANLGDQSFANQAQAYGRILTLPWQHIVNDDLGMLTGAPMKIGQGAGLALNDNFWSLWSALASGSVAAAGSAGNPNGALPSGYTLTADDGLAFWRTTSSNTQVARKGGTAYLPNKATGGSSALSTTSLQTAKALYDNQIDPNGNPLGFDGATPVLLHGPTNWQTAQQLLYGSVLIATGLASTSAASVQSDKNVWGGTMKPVMSRYVESAQYGNSATAWWLLYNPVALAVIEVCFLNGVDTPAVLTAGPDYQFDRLGISIRGTMPFGCNQQQFRGGVYSVGA